MKNLLACAAHGVVLPVGESASFRISYFKLRPSLIERGVMMVR
jgi:hypothetical protein